MALELGRRGADVIVNYANSTGAAEKVVAEIKANGSEATAIKANVTDVDQIVYLFQEAKKRFGRLNIVCSNSGVVSFGHVKDVTPEEFDRVFNTNTRGQFFVAREAYKNLEVGGRVILMGSITGQAKGVPKHAVYSGSKGAIETFARCMAIGEYTCSFRCASNSLTPNQTSATRRLLATWLHLVASRPTCTTLFVENTYRMGRTSTMSKLMSMPPPGVRFTVLGCPSTLLVWCASSHHKMVNGLTARSLA